MSGSRTNAGREIATAVVALEHAFTNAGLKRPAIILLEPGQGWHLEVVMRSAAGALVFDPSSERHLTIYGTKFREARDA